MTLATRGLVTGSGLVPGTLATAGVGVGNLAGTLNNPTLDLNFLTGTLDSRITLTRATAATYTDVAGVLQSAASNTARFDFHPTTHAPLGLLIEEARTNSVRNPRGEGAVPGTPGTIPTNWSALSIGLSQQIVGTGTQNGIPYVDIRLFGTTSGQFGQIQMETSSGIAAVNAQTWSSSHYLSLVGGSLTNIASVGIYHNYYTAGFGFIATAPATAITLTATQTRFLYTATVDQVTAAFINPALFFVTTLASGQAVDFTIRIGSPQLELGGFCTSLILPAVSSPAATARAADVATMPLGSWYRAGLNTLATECLIPTLPPAAASGIIELNDGTTANRIGQNLSSTTNRFVSNSFVASASQGQAVSANAASAGVVFKTAASENVTSATVSLNGGATASSTWPSGIATFTQLQLGSLATGNALNGTLRRVRYWSSVLSPGQLRQVST